MGGSVGQQEMVVIPVLGGTHPCTPSHARPPAAPKLCSFSACFFPQSRAETGMCIHTHILDLTSLVFKRPGRDAAPPRNTAFLVEQQRSHP